MSPLILRSSDHARALDLAARRIDEPLATPDAAWLDTHLVACPDCAAAAAAYDADRLLFGSLRAAPPEPPRDLWARTAAALEAESASLRPSPRPARRLLGIPRAALAPVAALAAVAIVVGAGFLNGSPAVPPPSSSGPLPTPIAVEAGGVAVLTRGDDGSYRFETGSVDEVCPIGIDTCETSPTLEGAQVARIGDTANRDAIMSPQRDSLVVVQRSATGEDGVYVVPVRGGTSAATPVPLASAVTTPVPTDPPVATAAPETASPDPSPASPTPSDEPATPDPSASTPPASDDPSASPEPTPEPTAETTAEPTPEPTAEATPEPSAEPTAEATPEPSAEPSPVVEVTPDPDGALKIAGNVIVVGSVAAYNADGSRFAFTARPSDGSAGPDVYVWDTSDPVARAVTDDHRSVFAGWHDRDLLVSRVVDGTPRTFAVGARSGETKEEHGDAAWLPTVAPDGKHAAWWDGTVRLAADGVTWVQDEGRLVIGDWPVSSGEEQVLVRGPIRSSEVRWDPDGTAVAVWTGREGRAGRLSVYPVDPDTYRARLGVPLLDDEPAFQGYSIESGRLVYGEPVDGGKAQAWLVAWDGDEPVGRARLDGEITVVR